MKKIVAVVVFLFIVAVSDAFGQTTADEWIKKADEYFDKGDYTNAITAYSEAIKKDNTNFDSYWGRGIAYYQIKNYNSAIADYNAALKINPNDDDILICRGSVYFDRKEYNAAVADYNAALKINPNNVFGYWSRAKAYFQMKNYDATIADLTTYINKNGTISNAYIMRGDAYGAKGIYHKAVADYRTGLEKGYDPSTFRVDKSNKADMWFCGAMYMEIIVNRFLGKSDVVTKYENWLKTVCDKNKVTRAEIEAFYRDNIRGLIAAMVDEEFKGKTTPASTVTYIKNSIILFFVKPDQFSYEHLLAVFALINLNQFMTISIDDSKIGNFDNYGRQIVTVDQYIRNLDDAGKQLNAPNNVGINWNELQTVFKSIIESLNSNLLEKFYNDSQEINRKLQKNR